MTVPSETNRSGPYNGNGVTTVFNYGFRILDQAHLQVIKSDAAGNETTLTLTTHYTVSGVGSAGGGAVTVLAAPAVGETIAILRNMPFTQETDLENQGAYYAQTVEDALDAAAMRDQQLSERLRRAVTIPASSDGIGGELADQLAADITRLAQSADEIDTVASIDSDVTTVAGIAADVALLADVSPVLSGTASAVRMDEKLFTGDGVTTTFALDRAPGVDENVLVWAGGAIQDTTDYSVSGTALTIMPAVANGVEIRTLIMTLVTANDIVALRDQAVSARDVAVVARDEAVEARDEAVALVGDAATKTYVDAAVLAVSTQKYGVITTRPLSALKDQDIAGAIQFYTQGYEPNNIFQGFYHDEERGIIYVGVQHTDGSGNVVFARIDMDGNFIDKSALHSTVIGKNVFGVEKMPNGDRKLWARDAVGWSLTRFDYVVDGQGANVQTYRVEDDNYYVTAYLSRSGKYILVNGRTSGGGGTQRARVFLRETLVNGGPGDYRGQEIAYFSMAPDPGNTGVMQGVLCDDLYAYGVYGGDVLSEAKFIRVYKLLTGEFVGKVEMAVGKAEAAFEGSGTGFEYEGIGTIICDDGIERIAVGSRSGQGGSFRNNRIWVLGGLPSRNQDNLLDNGALHEWQRGTSLSTTGGFLPDRFFCARQGAGSVLWERDTDVPFGLKARYAIKATGISTSTDVYLRHRITAAECAVLPRCFNVSAYFKRSTINGGFNIRVRQNPVADDWANSVQTRIKTVTATGTDYVRIVIPVSMSSADISNGLEFRFQATNVQNGEVIKFAGLQITKGSVVTAFYPIDKAENKDRCDRYFERLGGNDLPTFTPVASGFLSSATLARFNVQFKEKRAIPAVSFSGRPRVQGSANYTPADASGMTATVVSRKSALIEVVTVGLTTGQSVILDTSNLASNYLAIDLNCEPV